MSIDACPTCGLDEAVTGSVDDNGDQVLHCEHCDRSWNPTGTSDHPLNATFVGKLLRKRGLHRDYGQDGPDLKEDGGPGFAARGSATTINHEDFDQGTRVVYVFCDNDHTVPLVRKAIGDHYGNVIQRQFDNTLALQAK